MSLAERIARSKRPHDDVDDVLLPHDAIRDFLETSPVVIAMRIDTRQVHAALVDLHRWLKRPAVSHEMTPRSHAARCIECDSTHLVDDETEGQVTCHDCGAVCRSNMNVRADPVYNDDESKIKRQQRDASAFQGKKGVPSGPKHEENNIVDEVRHWNAFAPMGDVKAMSTMLNGWMRDTPKAHTNNARIAAASLYHRVQFPENVRSHVRERKRVCVAVHKPPSPRFRCTKGCGAMVHTFKEARHHQCQTIDRIAQTR